MSYPWHVHVYVFLFCEKIGQITGFLYIPHMLHVIYSPFLLLPLRVFQIILTSHLYTNPGNFAFPPLLQHSKTSLISFALVTASLQISVMKESIFAHVS